MTDSLNRTPLAAHIAWTQHFDDELKDFEMFCHHDPRPTQHLYRQTILEPWLLTNRLHDPAERGSYWIIPRLHLNP